MKNYYLFFLFASLLNCLQLSSSYGSNGYSGYAFDFNGNNSYMQMQDNSSLRPNNFTIEMWFKTENTKKDGHLIGKQYGISYDNSYVLWFSDTTVGEVLSFHTSGSSGRIDYNGIKNNKWYHVAVTKSGSTAIMYINGVNVGQSNSAQTTVRYSATPVMIGADNNNGDTIPESDIFDGKIDEFRMWNYARSQTEIRENMYLKLNSTPANLICYLPFEENFGNVTHDSSGNNNNAALINNPLLVNSTSPIGRGYSCTKIVSTTGIADFENVNLIANFNSISGSNEYVVTYITSQPAGQLPDSVNFLFSGYWIIRNYNNNPFNCNLSFNLGSGNISSEDQSNLTNLLLFKRETNSDSTWQEVSSASNANDSTIEYNNIASMEQFSIGSLGSSPLPIELISFDGFPMENNIILKWSTQNEINNNEFLVERRRTNNLNENSLWSSIGKIDGKNNTTIAYYEFMDENLQQGIYQYRLKQIDTNGNYKYFDLNENINIGIPNKFELHQNFPNPFNPITTIEFNLAVNSEVSLEIYDVLGRNVHTIFNNEYLNADFYSIKFSGAELQSGIYFYRLMAESQEGNFLEIKKMVLVK